MMEWLVIGILTVAVVSLLIALAVVVQRKPQTTTDVSLSLQQLTQTIQQSQSQTAVLTEKIAQLEPVGQAVNNVQIELRGLTERISTVEQRQNQTSQGITALGTGLAETGSITKAIVDATAAIREELSRAKNDLSEIQAHTQARQALEQQTAESIKRLEAIIAGTQTKGAAGENIVEVVFAKLPAEWQVRDMRVGDKAVEFGLRLPNNLILPIDSKWAATHLLEQFVSATDPSEQQKLKSQIESAVLNRTKEVRKYIDPNITVNFAIATVPDAIYDLCCGIQAEVFENNVVLVSYSMLVPYLLLVFQTVLRSTQTIDLHRLDAYLENVQASIKSVRDELDGRFARAITMLNNSRDVMALHLSKASNGLTSIQVTTSTSTAALPEPDDVQPPIMLEPLE
ncbi:MAG TPA: DNA recombination protein RmuC [Armatimonadota bacterium]|nr:DNA recombination protein RmuC [Armatimonadota bacterium]HOP80376.1 DNA recombination protein RmuC [Armatimonadota bacterium]